MGKEMVEDLKEIQEDLKKVKESINKEDIEGKESLIDQITRIEKKIGRCVRGKKETSMEVELIGRTHYRDGETEDETEDGDESDKEDVKIETLGEKQDIDSGYGYETTNGVIEYEIDDDVKKDTEYELNTNEQEEYMTEEVEVEVDVGINNESPEGNQKEKELIINETSEDTARPRSISDKLKRFFKR